MAERFAHVECSYTGGGIYVFTALFNGEVWLTTDFSVQDYGTYDTHPQSIVDYFDCDYDSHWKAPSIPLPTWAEVYYVIAAHAGEENCSNLILSEVETKARNCGWTNRLDEDPSVKHPDPHEERMAFLAEIVEVFEDFLDRRGIVIPNEDKEQDEDASNIYGCDFAELSDGVEEVLIIHGLLKEENT